MIIKNHYNHDTGPKLGNMIVVLNLDLEYVNSILARKLKCPRSTRLCSEPFHLNWAQLGKFQLKLITKSYIFIFYYLSGFTLDISSYQNEWSNWKLDYQTRPDATP